MIWHWRLIWNLNHKKKILSPAILRLWDFLYVRTLFFVGFPKGKPYFWRFLSIEVRILVQPLCDNKNNKNEEKQYKKEKSKTICGVQSVKSHRLDAAGADGGVGRITKTEPVAGFGSRRENMRMKELYVTITGFKYYYGDTPFKVGRKIKCVKEPDNPYDAEAIRATVKHIGTVGYIANSPYTVAGGTKSAGAIGHKVKKKFTVEVMFLTGTKIICRVVDGRKEKKDKNRGVSSGVETEIQVAENTEEVFG